MNLIQQLEKEEIERLGKQIPEFAPGDTVRTAVHPRGEACETWIMTRIGSPGEHGERARGVVVVAEPCQTAPLSTEPDVPVS